MPHSHTHTQRHTHVRKGRALWPKRLWASRVGWACGSQQRRWQGQQWWPRQWQCARRGVGCAWLGGGLPAWLGARLGKAGHKNQARAPPHGRLFLGATHTHSSTSTHTHTHTSTHCHTLWRVQAVVKWKMATEKQRKIVEKPRKTQWRSKCAICSFDVRPAEGQQQHTHTHAYIYAHIYIQIYVHTPEHIHTAIHTVRTSLKSLLL